MQMSTELVCDLFSCAFGVGNFLHRLLCFGILLKQRRVDHAGLCRKRWFSKEKHRGGP